MSIPVSRILSVTKISSIGETSASERLAFPPHTPEPLINLLSSDMLSGHINILYCSVLVLAAFITAF